MLDTNLQDNSRTSNSSRIAESVDPGESLVKNKRQSKVLHVINGEHYSGAERVQDLLGHRLPEFGFEATFACVKPGIFESKRQHRESQLIDLPMRNRFDLSAVRKLCDRIKKEGYSIVHAHTPRSALVGGLAASRCQIPFVFHVHSPTARDSTRWIVNWFNQKIESWSIRKAAKIITVSDSLRDYMKGLGFPASKIKVVPNGVPVQDAPRREPDSKTFVIGTVALFRPRKGTEVLLEAFGKLIQQNQNCRLLAVGPFENKDYEQQLKSKAQQLGIESHVEWTGFTDDVGAQFARMHAFALPSLFGEGLPMVVLESMSYGVPVVASDVEGIPQAIRNDRDGLIVKPGCPDDLSDKLRMFVECPESSREMGRNAFDRQRKRFSDVSMAEGAASVYAELLGQGQANQQS